MTSALYFIYMKYIYIYIYIVCINFMYINYIYIFKTYIFYIYEGYKLTKPIETESKTVVASGCKVANRELPFNGTRFWL